MIDLASYFSRIALTAPPCPDEAALRAIVLAHAMHIPFENLDAWRGRTVDLRPEAIERKLVHERRGGWCFEQNGLLGAVLRQMGFDVTDYAARVLWGRPTDAITPRTHRLLGVKLPEGLHYVDVGFGGLTPTGVLAHAPGVEQVTPHEPMRLVEREGDLFMQALVRSEWLTLYRFDHHPQRPVDFEAANFQLVHDPASYFRNKLIAALATPTGRLALSDRELAIHHTDGSSERRTLARGQQVLDALARDFGISLAGVDGLGERFAAASG